MLKAICRGGSFESGVSTLTKTLTRFVINPSSRGFFFPIISSVAPPKIPSKMEMTIWQKTTRMTNVDNNMAWTIIIQESSMLRFYIGIIHKHMQYTHIIYMYLYLYIYIFDI